MLGVSGGGHVATGACVWYERAQNLDPNDEIDAISAKPDAAILAYPLTDPASFAGLSPTEPEAKQVFH